MIAARLWAGSAFVIYGAGLAALLLADLIVTNTFPPEQIVDWAVFRSLVGVSAVVPLIGLEQVLVRSPQSSARILRLLAWQIPIIGPCVGMALAALGFVSDWSIGAGISIGSALSLVLFQYFRSHQKSVLSQLSQQGWKILALGVVLWVGWSGIEVNILLVGVVLLLLVDVLGLGALQKLPPARLHPQAPEAASALYAISSRFMVTALFMSLSIYAEQLVVNRLGSTEEAALYFTAATYFLFPASFLNGYAAFLIGPWIRDHHDRFLRTIRRYWLAIGLGVATYVAALSLVGWVGWTLTGPAVGQVDHGLQVIFALACLSRTLYLLPSGYIGVFGHPRQHDVLILAQLGILAVVIGVFLALTAAEVPVLYAVGIASTTNWALRYVSASLVMRLIARSRKVGP